MTQTDESAEQIQQQAREFRDLFFTVLMATSNAKGENDCSYTPYLLDEQGHLYIYISQLAHHTRNVRENANVGLMFVQDESATRNMYARKRLTLQADAYPVDDSDERRENLLNLLQERQGKMVGMLRQLPDFQLFELIPREGRFVRGFGDAWELRGPDLEVVQLSRG